jgi:hypothetical protein
MPYKTKPTSKFINCLCVFSVWKILTNVPEAPVNKLNIVKECRKYYKIFLIYKI